MTVERNKIIKFCEEYLKVKNFTDYCHNGLQVEGADKIERIITGVSLSQKLIKAAITEKAQMIIVHHGIFGDMIDKPPVIKGTMKNRLKLILENNINLAGFHLPLDAHPMIGNNISLCKMFGIKNTKPFDVGFIGQLDRPINFLDFVKIIDKKLNTKSYFLAVGPKMIKKIGIISGGASPEYQLAAELGADAYLCGDIRESIVRGAEEVGINIINAGHYNTEKTGIQNLGNLLAKKFKVKVEFVDIPCEI